MKTLANLITIACAATCFSCATGNQIHPSENYQTEKRNIGNIQTISTSSSIDIVYHQTSGSSYAEIYASDNVMPYIVLKESNGELTAYYKEGTSIIGENRCRIDVYAPSVTSFITQASGDILSVNASGDCSISHLECEESLHGSVNASGDLTLSGKCNKATLSVNASGDLDANNLKVNDVYAEVNASGDLSCHAARSITAKTFGSGSLTFSGNPSHVNTEGKNIHKRQ